MPAYSRVADAGIAVCRELSGDDILVVMADHGTIPPLAIHTTSEMVPLMIHSHQGGPLNIGVCETLSDIGATATAYFDCRFARKAALAF